MRETKSQTLATFKSIYTSFFEAMETIIEPKKLGDPLQLRGSYNAPGT